MTKEQIEQAALKYDNKSKMTMSDRKAFTAGATWAIDNLKVNLSDEQSNLYVNEIARLRAALERYANAFFEVNGQVYDVGRYAREALKK